MDKTNGIPFWKDICKPLGEAANDSKDRLWFFKQKGRGFGLRWREQDKAKEQKGNRNESDPSIDDDGKQNDDPPPQIPNPQNVPGSALQPILSQSAAQRTEVLGEAAGDTGIPEEPTDPEAT